MRRGARVGRGAGAHDGIEEHDENEDAKRVLAGRGRSA